jgi:hypothetical protein
VLSQKSFLFLTVLCKRVVPLPLHLVLDIVDVVLRCRPHSSA